MRIFKWPEPGTTYFWSDIGINPWPSNVAGFVSPCPGDSSTNWVPTAQFHGIIGVTRRSKNEVWFAWAAPSGGGFPKLHIQIAQIDASTWPLLHLDRQWQIWNPNVTFAYPSFYTNKCQDVGVAVAFGGGGFNPSSAVGIADSSGVLGWKVYYPELSNVCQKYFGEYLTVRQGIETDFAGFVYAGRTSPGIQWHPRFLEFKRV